MTSVTTSAPRRFAHADTDAQGASAPPSLGRRPRSRAATRVGWLFAAPALAVYIVFQLVPLIGAFILSFSNWSGIGPINFIGFRNYANALHDTAAHAALEHTVIYAAGTTVAKMVVGLGLALLINKGIRILAAYRTVLFLPALMSFVAVGLLWNLIYDPSVGLVNHVLSGIGIDTTHLTWLGSKSQALPALMIVEVWKWTGYHMVIFLAGLQTIPGVLYEAAAIDGAGAWTRLRHVTIPSLRPITTLNLVIAVAGGLNVFDLVYVTTNGGPYGSTQTVMTYVYQEAFSNYNFGFAAAMACLLFVIVAIVTVALLRLLRPSN